MTLDGKILRGLFEPEILKPAVISSKSGKCIQFMTLKTTTEYRHPIGHVVT